MLVKKFQKDGVSPKDARERIYTFDIYSNPTSHSECTAEQAYTWRKGKAVFASGSLFAPVTYNGKTFTPGQGNNVFIFPAMGPAIFAKEAKKVTDDMFITAAEAVAEQITEADFSNGLIYPSVKDILAVP